jgi:hypothetical protein
MTLLALSLSVAADDCRGSQQCVRSVIFCWLRYERSRRCFLTQGWEPDCESGGAGYLFIYLASPIITQSNNTYTQQFLSNPKTRKLQRPCLCLKHESKLTKNMHPWPAHVASATLDKNAHPPTRSLRTFSLLGAVDIYITKLLSNFYVNNVITLQSCVWLAMLVVIAWIKVKLAANGVRISISSTPTSSDDILDTFFNIEFIYILNADKLF